MRDADERAGAGHSADPLDPPQSQPPDRAERAARDHIGAGDPDGDYQTMGAGGLDMSYRGAATADATRTGGEIGTTIGGARSTGGMPTGAGTGSDVGTIGTSTGRGTGTFESGRSGDLAEAAMSEAGAPPMGASGGSGASVGGGAASTGGATAPLDPSPERAEEVRDR